MAVADYFITVDEAAVDNGELVAFEHWPDYAFATEKRMDQIIIEAANFSTVMGHKNVGAEHYSLFDKPLFEEPRRTLENG